MTIGIEATFSLWLKEEYGDRLQKNYITDLEKELERKELICPACDRTYPTPDCENCGSAYDVVIEDGSARVKCHSCGSSQSFKGKCDNDGSVLQFYLIGEDPTGLNHKHTNLREDVIRLLTEPIEFDYQGTYREAREKVSRDISFYQGFCDLSSTTASRVLHHLSNEKQLIEDSYRPTRVRKRRFVYKLGERGWEMNQEFLERLHKFSLKKPLLEFAKEIFEDFEERELFSLTRRTITDFGLFPTRKSNRISKGGYEILIWGVPQLKLAREYYEERFPVNK